MKGDWKTTEITSNNDHRFIFAQRVDVPELTILMKSGTLKKKTDTILCLLFNYVTKQLDL